MYSKRRTLECDDHPPSCKDGRHKDIRSNVSEEQIRGELGNDVGPELKMALSLKKE